MFRKYATLPDVDSAPDVYETPKLVEDSVIRQQSRPRSQSSASSYDAGDSNEDESQTSHINRQSIHPDQARNRFFPSRVDARDVDFSDRISRKPKSYRTHKGHRQRNGPRDGGSSGEETETLATRIARLKKEVEEVQNEISNVDAAESEAKGQQIATSASENDIQSITQLSKIVTSLQIHRDTRAVQKDLEARTESLVPATSINETQEEPRTQLPTRHQTNEDTRRVLAKAATLESRLSSLEAALGIPSNLLPSTSLDAPRSSKPILAHLNTLEAYMSTLTSTTVPSLESMKEEIDALSTSTARLSEARSAATSTQAALFLAQQSRSPALEEALRDARSAIAGVDDPALVAQIDALYGALPAIEALSPLLPATLERLKSLRVLHSDAAVATENLAELERKQAAMADEISKWREGLETLEKAINEGKSVTAGNKDTVEAWVRDLEARLEKLADTEQRGG